MTDNRAESALVTALRGSAIVRAFERMTGRIDAAAGESRVAALTRAATTRWRDLDRASRLRAIATAILTAVFVHVLIAVPLRDAIGWRALVIPAIATAQAALLLAVARSRNSEP